MLIQAICYIVLGYVLGSVMFGYVIPKVFCGIDVRSLSSDGNPGTANAFFYGGAVCGIVVLFCELLKGMVPVYLAAKEIGTQNLAFALVMAAPVLGHAFPFWGGRRRGGKGIAVSFGVLLGLYPMFTDLWLLIFWYLLFTLVIIIDPHSFRTVVTYLCWLLSGICFQLSLPVVVGNCLISCIVLEKHREELKKKNKKQIRFGFRRN